MLAELQLPLSTPLSSNASESEIDQKITQLMKTFCAAVNAYGCNVKPYSNSSLNTLTAFDYNKKKQILNSLVSYINIFVKTVENGHSIKDQKSVIWALFKEMGWRPTSDIFGYMTDDSVIEVYSADSRQIFRNLRYFDFVNFNLAEIFCYDWTQLFKRDQIISNELADNAYKILTAEITSTISLNTGWHQIEEAIGDKPSKLWVNHKFLSPVYDKKTGNVAGFLAITEAKL